MNETIEETEEPSSTKSVVAAIDNGRQRKTLNGSSSGIFQRIKQVFKGKNDTSLRETIEEYIDAAENAETEITSISAHERALISNILRLRDYTVVDVMIPRADIFSIDIATSEKELLSLLSEQQFSRIPVYRETLDDVVGTIHIKDVLSCVTSGKKIDVENLVREVPIVSPSMHVPDLLLLMKQMRKHMVLVVDEFGGIDGLVTINDVIEAIVGEIDDEYDQDDDPQIIDNKDGTVIADARFDTEEFEEIYGNLLTEDEREDIDTLGGLVTAVAGRVPARGEIINHESGMVFEVIDADPRRVNRLLIKNIPLQK